MNCFSAWAFALLAATWPLAVLSQTFPAQPVKVLLPYSANSGPDVVIRQIAEKIQREWDQPLTVDNKPGGNGWTAVAELKRAQADGYTLLVADSTPVALHPVLYKQLPFDPVKDLEPVAGLYATNFFIVVSANSPYRSVSDLVNAAKAAKGKLAYGTGGAGSIAHLGSAQLLSAAGAEMQHVKYRDLLGLYNAVSAGEVDWAFGTAGTVGPLLKAKKVRLLAYAGRKRLAGYEDIPTIAEAGGPRDFEVRTWLAIYAPKGTPASEVGKLNADIRKALSDRDLRERFASMGFEAWTGSPADVARAADADAKRYTELVKRLGITAD